MSSKPLASSFSHVRGSDRTDDGTSAAIGDSFHAAFAELFASAYRVSLRILGGQRELAEDMAAEAMARAYSHWSKIGTAPYREAWVVRVVTNLTLDEVKRRPRGVVEPSALSIEDFTASRVALIHALSALPRRQRDVIVLRYLSELSEREVADALKIGPGTVKTHLKRGMENLRGKLGDESEADGVA